MTVSNKVTMGSEDQTLTIPQTYRLQIRIIKMAKTKATSLGMKLPAYISQLIVKDNEGG